MSEKDYFVEFGRQLGELSATLKEVIKRMDERIDGNNRILDKHEKRIQTLEHEGRHGALPKWAVYLIVSLASALCGALGVKIPSLF